MVDIDALLESYPDIFMDKHRLQEMLEGGEICSALLEMDSRDCEAAYRALDNAKTANHRETFVREAIAHMTDAGQSYMGTAKKRHFAFMHKVAPEIKAQTYDKAILLCLLTALCYRNLEERDKAGRVLEQAQIMISDYENVMLEVMTDDYRKRCRVLGKMAAQGKSVIEELEELDRKIDERRNELQRRIKTMKQSIKRLGEVVRKEEFEKELVS